MTEDIRCSQLQIPFNELSPLVRQYLDSCDNSSIIKFMCDKINESSSSLENDNLEYLNRSKSFHDGRVPSPSSISSLASARRLEWDSGADVGYQPSVLMHPSSLSTLERMALGGCAESLIRTDPEGTNNCAGGSVHPIHKSVVTSMPSISSESKTVSLTIAVTSPREVTGIVNLPVYTNNEAVSCKSLCKHRDDLLKIPENISLSTAGDDLIQGNIPEREASGNANFHISEGTCPVNTCANENAVSYEEIAVTPLASVVNTISASSSSLASTIVPHDPESLHFQEKKSTSRKKRITRGIQVGETLVKRDFKNFTGGAISLPRSVHTDEDDKKDLSLTSSDYKVPKGTVLDSVETSSFDPANSFEYFPGDMCEPRTVKELSDGVTKFDDVNPTRIKNSLSNDLEENIACLRDILSQNQVSNKERQHLIKQLVERIVGTEYCEDFEEKNSSKKSTECTSERAASTKSDKFSMPETKQKKIVDNEGASSQKSYVPYCPIPGGRTYHVMGAKVARSLKNTSCSESDESKPRTCYLPMDRVKITHHSSSASEVREDSPVSAILPRKHNVGCICYLKTLEYAYEQNRSHKHVKPSEDKSHQSFDQCKSLSKDRISHKPNWWSPVTKSEKKRINETAKDKPNPLFAYIERERANQLHWIKNEINHLSNLAQLLEECATIKSDSPISVEKHSSHSSALRKGKKSSETVDNEADKLLSSARSSSFDEPITATMHHQKGTSRERIYSSTSPLLHHDSNQSPSMEQSSSHSVTESHSFPSRSSSRNMANSDISFAPGHKCTNQQSEAYVITFETVSPKKYFEGQNQVASRKPLKEVRLKIPSRRGRNMGKETSECHVLTSLKEQLEVHHPNFVKASEERKKCLEELAHLRSLRQITRKKLLQFTIAAQENHHNDDPKAKQKPKSACVKVAGRSSGKPKENNQQMCTRMKRKHRLPPEIQRKEAEHIKNQNYQTNRLMADIFSRRLQRKVLSGVVSLSNSVSIISSL